MEKEQLRIHLEEIIADESILLVANEDLASLPEDDEQIQIAWSVSQKLIEGRVDRKKAMIFRKFYDAFAHDVARIYGEASQRRHAS